MLLQSAFAVCSGIVICILAKEVASVEPWVTLGVGFAQVIGVTAYEVIKALRS